MQLRNSNRAVYGSIVVLLAGCSGPQPTPVTRPASPLAEYQVAAMPAGQRGDQIRLGKQIFDETPKYAGAHAGNQLSCSDCHIDSGRAAYAAPMINLANIFPRFSKRAGRVISLQERFEECFTRSENGSALPQDSREMEALTAYVDWLSRDGSKGTAYPGRGFVSIPALTGNSATGKTIYAAQCANCHGTDGAGVPPVLPPLWGQNSYNDGSGMNDVPKMAAFLMHNMPQNHSGTLTAQEAYDVAAFVHSMPRPRIRQANERY